MLSQPRHPRHLASSLLALALGWACLDAVFLPSLWAEEKKAEPASFIRYVDDSDSGKLQVAHAQYLNDAGVQLDLIGAVHLADAEYYDDLNERFKDYDVILFEMVGDPAELQAAETKQSPNLVRFLQQSMTRVLELEFQLDGIDYAAENFVHADLKMEEFLKLQKDRGESLFTFVQRAMETQLANQADAPAQIGLLQLMRILTSSDRASGLKLLIAEQLASAEALLGNIEAGGETVLLSERNKKVIEVLEEQLEEGQKKVGVFYGAGHYFDLEERVLELGFRKTGQTWLTAWDIPKDAGS